MSELLPAFPLPELAPEAEPSADWLWREVEIPPRVSGRWLTVSVALHALLFVFLNTGWRQLTPAAAQTLGPPETVYLDIKSAEKKSARVLPAIFPARRPGKRPGPGGQPDRPLPKLGAETRGPQAIVSTPPVPTHHRQLVRWETARLRLPEDVPRLPNIVIPPSPEPALQREFDPARLRGPGLTFDAGAPRLPAPPRPKSGSRLSMRTQEVENSLPRLAVRPAPLGDAPAGAEAPPGAAGSDALALPGVVALSADPAAVGASLRLPAGNLEARLVVGPHVGPGTPGGIPDGVPGADGGSDGGPGGWSGGEGGLVIPGLFVAPAGPTPPGPAIVGAPEPSAEENSSQSPGTGASTSTSVAARTPAPPTKAAPSAAAAPAPKPRSERAREMLETARANAQGARRADAPPVFTTYLFLASLTSQSSTWRMHYSEREPDGAAGAPAPPQVVRKADPCYPSDVHWERTEGTVVLTGVITAEGAVTEVSVVQGMDPRIDARAADAFARSTFLPARKNGRPVALDVVVEIPFRLAPCY